MKYTNIILGVITALLIMGAGVYLLLDDTTTSEEPIQDIIPEEFSEVIESEEIFLVNTHTPYEGEIEGTDLIAEDWENIEAYTENLPEDKEDPIAVYCMSDRMSSYAAEQLAEMGYENIYNLEGGMIDWTEQGKEIIHRE